MTWLTGSQASESVWTFMIRKAVQNEGIVPRYIPSKRATTLVIKIKSDWLASQFVSQSTNLNLLFCYLLYEGPQVAMPKTPDMDVAHPKL
jgi:hypothetical protein